MNLGKGLNIINRKIKQYVREEYGTTSISVSFAKDIYEQHHIFITVTFSKVCDELFAKGRDHKALTDFIDNLFVRTFHTEWKLQRITLLKEQSTGEAVIQQAIRMRPPAKPFTTQIATILRCTQKVKRH